MRPIDPKLNLVACCLPPTRYGSLHPQKATSLRPAAYSTDSTAHSLLCQDRKKRVSPRLSRLSLSNRISKLVRSIDEPIADAWLSSAMASIRDYEELDVGRRQHLSVNLGSSQNLHRSSTILTSSVLSPPAFNQDSLRSQAVLAGQTTSYLP